MSTKPDNPKTVAPSAPQAPPEAPDAAVDLEIVRKSARLARLAVTDEEMDSHQAHFSRLLAFVQDVTNAPIDNVEPMAHPMDMVQRLRPDAVTEDDKRDSLLTSAPKSEDGFYLVPRVIE